MDEVKRKRNVLHYLMQVGFVEIRAAETLAAASKVADVFHGLPMALTRCTTGDDYDAEFQRILERAKRWELGDYLLKLKGVAEESVG